MEYQIDIDSLRKDLMDYYGTAMFSASPIAVVDIGKAERLSDREIVEMAQKLGFDLGKYVYE